MRGRSFPYGQPPAQPKGVALPDPGTVQFADVTESASGERGGLRRRVRGRAPGRDARAPAPAQRRLERAARLGARVAGRPSGRRDGPPDRLLVAADPDGAGHPRAGVEPRAADRCPGRLLPRHQPLRAARAGPRLLLERHLGRPGHHRHLRGQALRARRRPGDHRLRPLHVPGPVPAVRRPDAHQLLGPHPRRRHPGGLPHADHACGASWGSSSPGP